MNCGENSRLGMETKFGLIRNKSGLDGWCSGWFGVLIIKYKKMKRLLLLLLIVTFIWWCSTKQQEKVTYVNWITKDFIKENYDSRLHFLNLSNKWLTWSIDFEKILSWDNLKYDIWYIDMSMNQIKKIWNEFNFFPNLKELNLSYNEINYFWLTWSKLQKLYLHKNNLSSIDLSSLKQLLEVNLWYNQFTWFENIKLPENIYSIQLQHNKLKNLNWLEKLKKWRILKVEFNGLSDDVVKKLQKIDSLSWFDVSYKYQNF